MNSVPSLSPSPNHTEDKMLRPWPGLATCCQDLPTLRGLCTVVTFFSLCLLVLWVSAWTLPPHTCDLGQSIICCPCHVTLKASLGFTSLADVWMVWTTLLWPSLSAGHMELVLRGGWESRAAVGEHCVWQCAGLPHHLGDSLI